VGTAAQQFVEQVICAGTDLWREAKSLGRTEYEALPTSKAEAGGGKGPKNSDVLRRTATQASSTRKDEGITYLMMRQRGPQWWQLSGRSLWSRALKLYPADCSAGSKRVSALRSKEARNKGLVQIPFGCFLGNFMRRYVWALVRIDAAVTLCWLDSASARQGRRKIVLTRLRWNLVYADPYNCVRKTLFYTEN
jgi:hypothetical protein